MAFLTPVRRATAVSAAANAVSWTPSWTWITDTAVAAGEKVLWVAIVSADGIATQSETSAEAWVADSNNAGASGPRVTIFTLETTSEFAAGAAPAFAISSSASEQFSAVLYALKATSGSNIEKLTSVSIVDVNGSNTNPPAITNSSGSAQDVTVITLRGGDSTVTASGIPTDYTNHLSITASGTGGATTNSCERNINIADSGTEDPGAFTVTAEQWTAYTLGFYEVTGSITVNIAVAGMAYVAQSITKNATSIRTITPASMNYVAQTIIVKISKIITVITASTIFAAQGIVINARRFVVIASASIAMTGRAISVFMAQQISVSAATIIYAGKDMLTTASGTARRLAAHLGLGLKLRP